MILYNHPAENFLGEFLVIWDQQSTPSPHPYPTRKSAYNEQGFFIKDPKIHGQKVSILNA